MDHNNADVAGVPALSEEKSKDVSFGFTATFGVKPKELGCNRLFATWLALSSITDATSWSLPSTWL